MIDSNPYASPQAPVDPPLQPKVPGAWSVAVTAALASATAGLVSRFLRPLVTGGLHYEALAGLFVAIGLSVFLLVSYWRRPQRYAEQILHVGHALVWGMHFLGWVLMDALLGFTESSLYSDLAGILGGWWLGLAALMWVLWRFRKPKAPVE